MTWTPPTTGGVPTSYNVTINDSSSPVVIADNGSPVYTHTFTGLVSDTLYTVSATVLAPAMGQLTTTMDMVTGSSGPNEWVNDSTVRTLHIFYL